jgi:hypothetical protein
LLRPDWPIGQSLPYPLPLRYPLGAGDKREGHTGPLGPAAGDIKQQLVA